MIFCSYEIYPSTKYMGSEKQVGGYRSTHSEHLKYASNYTTELHMCCNYVFINTYTEIHIQKALF